tara:strand:+ start:5590 stop:6036 length:447 start_codon:yes stop_codon:yes gene_type:complete
MANIYVAKDNHSFYIMNMFSTAGEQITYNWSLSKSYSVVVGRGKVSIDSDAKSSIGVHTIAPNTQITMESYGESIAFCAFLLNDDTSMGELFPTASTLTQLKTSSSNLIELAVNLPAERLTPQLSYTGMTSPVTFSLSDLETKVLGAI